MQKIILSFCCLCVLIVNASAQRLPQKLFMVCGDTKVLLVDYNTSMGDVPNVIWSWDGSTAKDIPDSYHSKFKTMDDCKSYGNEIMVSSSTGAIAIIGRTDNKVHFYAEVPNSHSIEKLPGGFLAAASSTHAGGNKILLFDINKGNTPVFSDSLYSAHGVVWDNKTKSLFALGYEVLREYKLNTLKRRLELKNEWKIPGKSGHDMQMAPGGKYLFLTSESGIFDFDIVHAAFGSITGFTDTPNIKSIGQNDSLQFIYTIPEESWWTFHVRFDNPSRIFHFPDMKVYKARWY